MLNLMYSNIEEFKEYIKDKNLILYGAGDRCLAVVRIFECEKDVKNIVDKNKGGFIIELDNSEYQVKSLTEYCKCVDVKRDVLLITQTYLFKDIVKELNDIKELNGLTVFVASVVQDVYHKSEIKWPNGIDQIPKKIHYCWFGGSEIPPLLKQYINSWQQKNPEYEVLEWNESNYDIKKNDYMYEAYQSKKWGFVSDYARLDIIYNEGGIYLDTDVEVLNSLDKLLIFKAFFGFCTGGEVNSGSGFGAIRHNEVIKRMRDYYEGKHFINKDGSLNQAGCTFYQNPVLKSMGFDLLHDSYQEMDGTVLLPSEVMSPLGKSGLFTRFSDETLSCHYTVGTHKPRTDMKSFSTEFAFNFKTIG